MRKLRFTWFLPAIQFVIATILLQWGYRAPVSRGSEMYVPTGQLICKGLNAPALLFRFLDPIPWGPKFDWIPRSILGFYTDDLFFLAGVIVVWYIVGRALDHRRTSRRARQSSVAIALVRCSLLLALGVILFFAGLRDLGPRRSNNPAPPVGAILTLVWSIALIFGSGRRLVASIRSSPRTVLSDE
jgi:hypothetical protein